ncbi:methyl-accepting chemotaxis protein [uncultured Methylobacterium sp.]|jgi:uncharacterized protein YoxC|uniref:methyl-accepting chemotaxis protein n=1 Tax=uncultured Methylobacterium sp. TaxID=157278 RepID=UPI00260483BA|nr:methyl-accepting chemotaxis protein [uncultured Methylobacterium sp.]
MFRRRSSNDELLEVLGRHAGVGLWDAVLHGGDPMHPKSRWSWTAEFRRLVGFSSKEEFPDVVQSWSDRLHPDDAAPTFATFGAALANVTNKGAFDVTYRLKLRDGSYRWFRATGGVVHAADGTPLRACGSLVDIHDAVTAMEKIRARAGQVDELVRRFSHDSEGMLGHLAGTAGDMEGAANTMSSAAERTSLRSNDVATASSQTSANVETVAAATEELAATIRELTSQAAHSSQWAAEAAEKASRTDGMVQALSQAADKIGAVVGMINTLASQTNLLALNATIEAARAGEAGRGFAVVAAEVKELATQTAKATDEIATQIAEIRGATGSAVAAIGEIGGAITGLRDTTRAMMQAMQEQGAATSDIARNVTQAASGARSVSGNIGEVRLVADETGRAADAVLASSRQLAEQSEQLGRSIRGFLAEVRAA